jgi:hypothetical protein
MHPMKTVLASTVLAVALAVPALAVGQADPVGAVKADLAKLKTHAIATSATIVADAQKLTADATAAKGSTKAQAKAAVKPDLTEVAGRGREPHGGTLRRPFVVQASGVT